MKLITLTAPSGAGKDTILNELVNRHDKLNTIVSYTSRPMRAGESEGKEYHFKTYDEMNKLLNNDGLLGHRIYKVSGGDTWIYGIPMNAIDFNSNKIYIVIVDYDGLKQIRSTLKSKCMLNNLTSFYIDASYQNRYTRTFNRENNKIMNDEDFKKFLDECNRRFDDDNVNVLPAKDDADFVINNDYSINVAIKRIEGVLAEYGIY